VKTTIACGVLLAVVILLGSAVARGAAGSGAPDGPPPDGEHPGLSIFSNEEDRAKMAGLMQRARSLRYLEDADVRTEIGIMPEQELEINALRERATNLGTTIRDEIRAELLSRLHPDMTEEEQAALRLEAVQIIADTLLGARADFESMLDQANEILTLRQKKQLADITRERSALEETTGNLAVLLTAEAREACGLTPEQVDKICGLLKRLAEDVKRTRDKTFGADKKLTKEERESDAYKDFLALRKSMIERTREKVLAIFPTRQRDKVEEFLNTHRGFRGPRRGMGAMGTPGAPRRPPAPPSPGAPAPAAPAPAAPAPATPANPK